MDHLQLKSAWKDYVLTGKVSPLIRAPILDSWRRCQRLGINPYQKAANRVLPPGELAARRASYQEVLEVSLPIMETLCRFVAGSGFLVALADRDGILLEVKGDPEVVEAVKKGNFIPGADWSERGAGTNGVGTVLVLRQPLQVYSYEHFCICSHKWTCSGAPIFGPEGELLGVIDMTGPYEKVNPHTLGIVVAAASAISSQLDIRRAWQACKLSDDYKAALLDSISEGVLALDAEGRITMINGIAAALLGLKPAEVEGKLLSQVIDRRNQALLEMLAEEKCPTDQEVFIYRGGEVVRCMLTARPVAGARKGKVVVLNELRRARQLVHRMMGARARFTFEHLVGKNKDFLRSVEMAKAAAESKSNVLLLGESGTGKDVFAQAIHNASARRKGPFVALNCAAIPRDLLGSELFGYTEGAFTGAKRGGNPGKFELADGGTLFLDEIGEMPPELQTLLLRVLEERCVVRIGGTEVIPVDVRIIAATNKDLFLECQRGNFRADLYYRLNVIAIYLVPLRHRLDDLEELTWHFIRRFAAQLGKEIEAVEPEVWERFRAYHWPGNVRELQNVIERAVNVARGKVITVDLLPEALLKAESLPSGAPRPEEEKEMLLWLLKKHRGNITSVARELRVARSTVYRKIYKYQLAGAWENA